MITPRTSRTFNLRPTVIGCLAVASAALSSVAAAQPVSEASELITPGRILVMPQAGLPDAALTRILKEHGAGHSHRRIGRSELRIVDLPPGLERQAVERLSRHPHIKFAEVDQLSKPNLSTNDPYLGSQWHLAKIGAMPAWDQSQGAGVTVAILDTGVDASHPDLAPSLVPGWNFFNNTSDTSDAYNHGTGVAGTAAAAMANAMGVAGVSGRARIMPIRISDATGYGSWSAMAQGLTHAADKGARIANISFSSAASSASVKSAADYLRSKGGLVFVSAGNTGAPVTTAANGSMIVVSATTDADTRASWSSYGPVVSLSAPGTGIYTTARGGGYVSENGTSFAAPVAAGVAALMVSIKPTLTSAQLQSALFSSAVDLGAVGRDDHYGHGRVDAYKAVQAALATTTVASDVQAPTVSITSPVAYASVSGLVAVTPQSQDNVGVTKMELRINGSTVATDTATPFGFSWDSTRVANGSVGLTVVAYDAAGNSSTSPAVMVTVANTVVADTVAPAVRIGTPADGSRVSAGTVTVSVSASDDRGATGLTQVLYIDGVQVASASGSALSYRWNTKRIAAGAHTLRAVARDAAGNVAESWSRVTR